MDLCEFQATLVYKVSGQDRQDSCLKKPKQKQDPKTKGGKNTQRQRNKSSLGLLRMFSSQLTSPAMFLFANKYSLPSMVKNTFNSSTGKAHEGGSEFKANLTHSENLSQQQKQANYLYSYKKKRGGGGG